MNSQPPRSDLASLADIAIAINGLTAQLKRIADLEERKQMLDEGIPRPAAPQGNIWTSDPSVFRGPFGVSAGPRPLHMRGGGAV